METAKKGDSVKIHYTGRLDDGEVFDSSKGREPLSFTLGSGQVIPGFDEGVTGMAIGEEKTSRSLTLRRTASASRSCSSRSSGRSCLKT